MDYDLLLKPSDLPAGTMQTAVIAGQELLVANVDGNFYAIAKKCPHMGADLCQGKLTGSVVTCPKHGARFDVKNGQAVDPAKILFLKIKTKNAVSFPLKADAEKITVTI